MAISLKLLNPGEHLILSCRQHVKALIGPALILLVLLAIGVAVQVAVDGRILHWVVWVLVLLGALWFFGRV